MTRELDHVFVGGTGRSGTHVLARLLGHHSRYRDVEIEARFHCNPRGFPDLLGGRVTLAQFVRKLRRFWWHRIKAGEPFPALLPRLPLGREERGLYKVVPRNRFDAAVGKFEAAYGSDPRRTCRALFDDLLGPLAAEAGKPGLVEMSSDNVAEGPTLLEVFPDARLIHTVRDGRDAGASKVGKRQKREHPRDGFEGLRWWERRLRRIDAAAREIPPDRLLTISLDELAYGDREDTYRRLLQFLELEDEPEIRACFDRHVIAENAHRDRWRTGLSDEAQEELRRRYEDALDRLAADGVEGAAELRRTYERAPA
ncbi:MAG TPA: sulfotransferase [Solirubrobacterales bacterium]|nr:sulfotransferase [Solirubrobacterales bacterium]